MAVCLPEGGSSPPYGWGPRPAIDGATLTRELDPGLAGARGGPRGRGQVNPHLRLPGLEAPVDHLLAPHRNRLIADGSTRWSTPAPWALAHAPCPATAQASAARARWDLPGEAFRNLRGRTGSGHARGCDVVEPGHVGRRAARSRPRRETATFARQSTITPPAIAQMPLLWRSGRAELPQAGER